MGKIIVVANQKGGVAKTTTAAALAAGLTTRKYKTLAIDLDPQGNLSQSMGANNRNAPTIFEVLKKVEKASDVIQHLEACDIMPANTRLAAAEQEINDTGKEYRLKEQLEKIIDQYDYIVIDTPPSLGVLTVNAFTAADLLVITITPGIFATQGMIALYETIQTVKKYCNKKLEITGILITRFNPQAYIHKDMKKFAGRLSADMGTKVFDTYIRNGVAIEEAQANKEDIFSYKRSSTVATDYNSFVDELLKDVKNNG